MKTESIFASTLSRERAALVALYDATGGPNWEDSTNWLTAEPIWTWHGVDTDAAGRVTKLSLGQNGLTGSLPAELGDLASLEVLHLYYNRLTGPIPEALGKLPALWDINLIRNALTGPIPEALGDLPNLQWLTLADNQLTGPIPPVLGNLPKLEWLIFFDNGLTGPIPAEWNPGLVYMELSNNQLTGPIPEALGHVFNLRQLRLGNNSLSDPLPLSLRNLNLLETLWFDGNLSVCAPQDPAFQAWMRGRDARGPTCGKRPPATVGTLPDRTLAPNGTLNVEVSRAFVDPDGDALTYTVSSSAPQVVTASVAGTLVTLTAVGEGAVAIQVTASDSDGLSATQSFRVRVTAPFTDDPIVPGETPVRAVHFTELRVRIDILRREAGLAPFSWTEPVLLAGVTRVRLAHLLDLREALSAAYAAAGRAAPRWTDASPAAGSTPIRAAHVTELRAAVLALE